MTTEALLSYKKTVHGVKSQYASFLARRKKAHKSKGQKGINIKKRILLDSGDDDHKNLENKRRLVLVDEEQRFDSSSSRIRQLISGCGSIYEYECLDRINNGSYGTVYRARHVETGEIVAVKKESHGLCESSLTEVDILRSLDHASIVEYKEVATDDHDGVYVVMEYAEHDLHEYISDMTKWPIITLPEVKRLMKELLEGVECLHKNRVMHRDIKPSNVLINSEGKLKICDFGMSRHFPSISDPTCMTPRVGTLWYRAPEVLLGAPTYQSSVDMWSVGCVMAEFFSREVLFRGKSELEQIHIIQSTLQQPKNLLYNKLSSTTSSKGGPVLTEDGFDLLRRLLDYDPLKRITAEEALNHVWFDESSS